MRSFYQISEMKIATQVLFFYLTCGLLVTVTKAQAGLCPAPNGDFPNPSSELCTTFFRCVQGIPSLLRCPANQRFDFLFRFCRSQESVDCFNQLQVFATPNLGEVNAGLLPLSGSTGIGSLGAVSSIGAGLPDRGLMSLLRQLDGDEDGQTQDNQVATLLVLSALMNQMNSAKQQDTSGATLPIRNLYQIFDNPPLDSLTGQGSLVTGQNYQQADNYGRHNAGTNSDSGLSLENVWNPSSGLSLASGGSAGSGLSLGSGSSAGSGLSIGSGSSPGSALSLGSGSSPGSGLSLGSGRTFIFIPQFDPSLQHHPQGQGRVLSPGTGTDIADLGQSGVIQEAKQGQETVKDPVSSPGQDTIQNQSRPGGQSSSQNSGPPPARRFPRRRGQGQRRRMQGHLADPLLQTTDSPLVNTSSTLGSVGLFNTA